MALLVCDDCGTAYAPALRCPHCGANAEAARFDWEVEVPKVTSGGPTNGPADSDETPEAPSARAPKAELVEHAVTVAGVDPDEAAAMTKSELAETIAAAAPPPPPGE